MRNDATVKFGYDGRDLNRGVADSEKRLTRFAKGTEQGFNRLKGVIGSIGIGLLARHATEAVASMDRLRRGMTTLEGSAEGAAARMEELRQASMLPGVDFEQAIKADIKLRSVGMAADMSKRAITEMGNALSLAGGSSADLDGVVLALTQIISKGKVSAEEINQIAERVPQVRAVMKDLFGTADSEAIQKMGISAEDFVERLIAGFGKLQRATAGLDEKIQDFKTNIKLAEEAFMEGMVKQGVDGAQSLGDAIADNIDQIRDLGSAASGALGFVAATFKDAATGLGDIMTFTKALTEGMSIEEAMAHVMAIKDEQAAQAAKLKAEEKAAADEAKKNADTVVDGEVRKQKAIDETIRKRQQERNAARETAMADLEVLRLQARGQDKKAEKLQRELRIADDARKYQKDLGASPEQALKMAREKANLEEDIARREKGLGRRIRTDEKSLDHKRFGLAGTGGPLTEDGGVEGWKRLQQMREVGLDEPNAAGRRRGQRVPVFAYDGLGHTGQRVALTAEKMMAAQRDAPARGFDDLGKKIDVTNELLGEALK